MTVEAIHAANADAGRQQAAGKNSASSDSHHRLILLMSSAVIPLAFVLRVVGEQRVGLWFAPQYPLPDTCLSRLLFHADCPGCGLTRSIISLAHGDLVASWHFHRVGWLVAILILSQIPYRIYAMRTGRTVSARAGWWVAMPVVGLMLVSWVAHLAGM